MSCDVLCKNTLAPLVLRLALAGIFIYHGVGKVVGPDKELGAAWANHFWRLQGEPPQIVLDHLRNLPREKYIDIENDLGQEYARSTPTVPAALQNQVAQLAVAWGELIGGIALLVGLLTRLAAVGEIAIQIGAIFWVTWAQGFSFAGGGGYEFNLMLLVGCLALVFLGGGILSVDHFLFRSRRHAATATSTQPQSEMAGRPVQPV